MGRLSGGLLLGMVVLAVAGALGTGTSGWLWAILDGNQETHSEAAGWFLVFAIIGAIAFAPFGAILGLVQRVSGRWPRRRWFTLIGLVLGLCATGNGVNSSYSSAAYVLWPLTGFLAGKLAHTLFLRFVVDTVPDAPS